MNSHHTRPCSSPLQNRAFTLAEVLITLVIIGVVAAMTIPTLINNTQKNEIVAGLKKANSVLSQAVYKIGQNKGYPVGDYSFFSNADFIDEFAKVVNVNKKCSNLVSCGGLSMTDYKQLNNHNGNFTDGKTLITTDGQLYSAVKINPGNYIAGLSDEDGSNTKYRIFVDVNGGKKPNQLGRDVFWFYVVDKKGILPAGSDSTSDCNLSSSGESCAGKVLRENAMNY